MLSSFLRVVAESRISEVAPEIYQQTQDDPLMAIQIAAVFDALDQMARVGYKLDPAAVQSAVDGTLGPNGRMIQNRVANARRKLEIVQEDR